MTFTIQPAHMNAALMHVQYIAYTKIDDTKKNMDYMLCDDFSDFFIEQHWRAAGHFIKKRGKKSIRRSQQAYNPKDTNARLAILIFEFLITI